MTEMSAAQFRQVIDVDLNAPFIVGSILFNGVCVLLMKPAKALALSLIHI